MDCNICICNNFQYRAWTSDFSSLSSTYCEYHIVPTWDSQDKAGFESLDIFNFFFSSLIDRLSMLQFVLKKLDCFVLIYLTNIH